ncbi:MAG: hypothetical protein IPM17_09225 [Verrucomicrobia bacterium]|jgi:hypothetical protein|nr:hypothetical protein [Verrucomicrobiota bacterium]
MPKERILITVKTYPTLSRKYGETVCTAGVRKDGSWVRIYPVPFRRLDEKEQYRKFDWLECDLIQSRTDPRPETRRPADLTQFKVVGHVGTADNWRERRALLLKKAAVHTRLAALIDQAKANTLSLAVFKPTRILDFIWEEDEREWDAARLAEMRNRANQGELFAEEPWRQVFQVIPKLPYNFSYRFADADGRESELQVLDWEVGALYWNCLRDCGRDEQRALAKVRAKYFDEFKTRDLHFFLGTTQQFHFVAPNPWVIVGVFPIPHEQQMNLL